MSFFRIIIILISIIKIFPSPYCKEPLNYCVQCNPVSNLCSKCAKSEILIPDENDGCKGAQKCFQGKNLCIQCDEDGKLCEQCEKSYYPDTNGGCTYSEGCAISYKGECLECLPDYILIGKEENLKICKFLSIEIYKNCEEINIESGICEKCEEGYYLNSERKCTKVEHCKESVFGNCISCVYSYYFNKKEDKCKNKTDNEYFYFCKQAIDDENCDICDDGFYFDENGFCVPTKYCLESEKLQCTKCLPGYYLANNNKCSVADNCDYVDPHTFICTFCNKNYYLDAADFKCKSNLDDNEFKHCKKVIDNKCTLCENDYYLGEDLKCSNTKNCLESENGICLSCTNNYYLGLDNLCTNVENCIYSIYGECLECKEGYYYNRVNESCIKANENYKNCKVTCYYDEICCECKNNSWYNSNNSLCFDNTEEGPFYKCGYSDDLGERCEDCIEGYYIGSEDSKCSRIESCKISENEYKCLECDDYYCLDIKNQKCENNKILEDENKIFFINCKFTNEEGTKCEKCLDGYEVGDKGYCLDHNFCEEKNTEGECLKCKDNEEDNNNYCLNKIIGCVESRDINCLRCDNLKNLFECTECKEGYTKGIYRCEKIENEN